MIEQQNNRKAQLAQVTKTIATTGRKDDVKHVGTDVIEQRTCYITCKN